MENTNNKKCQIPKTKKRKKGLFLFVVYFFLKISKPKKTIAITITIPTMRAYSAYCGPEFSAADTTSNSVCASAL
jgi:hypothetical protein